MKSSILFAIGLPFVLLACQPVNTTENMDETTATKLKISKEKYGATPYGEADLYTLENKHGLMMKVTNYGGIVTELHVPDKNGAIDDITLGFDSIADYVKGHPGFGALIGRYGNRIAGAKFSIDGQEYQLEKNNGNNSLHGGSEGFSRRLWDAKAIETDEYVGIEFSRRSVDMEEGFPGNLDITIRYLLNNENEWRIEYEATTDKKTPVNLTQHIYFNLNGAGNGDILNHKIMLKASRFTPVNEELIPTGALQEVEGTPFDFRESTFVGARIEEDFEQLKRGRGYDHNWVFDRTTSDSLELLASVYEEKSGRLVEVLTTEPGVQFYCGNFLTGKNIGKGGKPYPRRSGLCLETQHFPDSPNQDQFPSTILEPGQQYKTTTVYRFSVK